MTRRFAILGDIHANLEALTEVLRDARSQSVTDFICIGDVVGYNADPVACLRIVRDELKCPTVRGNHDQYCSNPNERLEDFHPLAASATAWTRRQLGNEDAEWLCALPYVRCFSGFTIVHSTLDVPERWGYVYETLDAEANFTYQQTPLCFHGHTHIPMAFEKRKEIERTQPEEIVIAPGGKFFINTGSVGQTRDGDPRSSYVIYDTATRTVTFRRIEYDITSAMEKIRKAGLPERLAVRLAMGQ